MIKLANKFTNAAILSILIIAGSATTAVAKTVPLVTSEGMANMQKQMDTILTTTDSNERARLMNEHMKSMQSTLSMMQKNKDCMMMNKGEMGSGMMKNGEASGGNNMMQMMMDQMMQHQKAMQNFNK